MTQTKPKTKKLSRERELYLVSYITAVRTAADTDWVRKPSDVHRIMVDEDCVEDISLAEVKTVWNLMKRLGFLTIDGFSIIDQ